MDQDEYNRDFNRVWPFDFIHAATILAICPWIIFFAPFNSRWINGSNVSALVFLLFCVAFGISNFADTFPGYWFFLSSILVAASFGPLWFILALALILYVVGIDPLTRLVGGFSEANLTLVVSAALTFGLIFGWRMEPSDVGKRSKFLRSIKFGLFGFLLSVLAFFLIGSLLIGISDGR